MEETLLIEVRYIVKPGLRDAFADALADLRMAELSREEPGCLGYEYLLPVDSPDQVVLLEQWESEAAQRAHAQSAHFAKLMAMKDEFLADTQVHRLLVREA